MISYVVVKKQTPQSSSTCKGVGPDARALQTSVKVQRACVVLPDKMWEIYPVHAKRTQTVSAELVAILTWTKADGGHLRCRARLVARGYPDRHEGLWTPPSLRLCVHAEISWLACAVRRNGTHWSGDVRQHVLQRDFKDRSFSVKLAADALRLWERTRKRQISTQDIDVRLVRCPRSRQVSTDERMREPMRECILPILALTCLTFLKSTWMAWSRSTWMIFWALLPSRCGDSETEPEHQVAVQVWNTMKVWERALTMLVPDHHVLNVDAHVESVVAAKDNMQCVRTLLHVSPLPTRRSLCEFVEQEETLLVNGAGW